MTLLLRLLTTSALAMYSVFLWGCATAFTQEDPENTRDFATPLQTHAGLAYMAAGEPGKPMVLFVHGTPGSWHAFKDYLNHPRLKGSLHMLAVDRPGFGRSAQLGLKPSLDAQSAVLLELLTLRPNPGKVLIVGHSLGGSIGLRTALDHPQHVGALLSISASLSPELGRPRWYNRLADLPLIKHLIPGDLYLANEEILPLRAELAKMAPELAAISIPVTIVQGSQDGLVDPHNADYAKAHLIHADLTLRRFNDEGHFIVWSHTEQIVDEILRLVQLL